MKKLVTLILLSSFVGSCAFNNNTNYNREVASVTNAEVYPYRVRSEVPHEMRIINDGTAALYERVKMIREAKTSLVMEYFIFNPDTAGRIIVSELVKAAKRNVKVRVMVDKSVAVFALDEFYAQAFKDNNIELRYYNPASVLRVSTVQFRDHRKLIVRDGEEAITGGRNIADEYFQLAKEFNFLDRDVWVKGEIVKAMAQTFDIYWDSSIVETPTMPKKPSKIIHPLLYKKELAKFNQKAAKATEIVSLNEEDKKVLDFVLNFGEKKLSETPARVCSSVAFATDKEGGNFKARLDSEDYNNNYRLLRKEIAFWMTKVQDEVILDSPYFLNDDNSREILNGLLDNNKKVTILTNSLASTDAVYVSTVFSDEVKKYTPNKNFNAYIYKGVFSDESELYSPEVKASMWGTHSKTIVFNDNSFMVGTFNIDNRSNFYNSEMALFCQGSSDLAKDVEDNIRYRMKTSYHLNAEGVPDDGTHLLEGNTSDKKRIFYLIKLPSNLAQFLL